MNKELAIKNNITNTLKLLKEKGLLITYNNVVSNNNVNGTLLTWPNHKSNRLNCGKKFLSLEQYFYFLENRAYTCLLKDYSIIRACYTIKKGKVLESNLLWWPSPIPNIEKILITDDNICNYRDLVNQQLSDIGNLPIVMRTPIRFDYDSKVSNENHPYSHVHFNNSECRLCVNKIIDFNEFISFIYKNFYPEIYSEYKFWNKLPNIKFHSIVDGYKYNVVLTFQ